MRTFKMQWVLLGINISIGIVSSLIIVVGEQLFGIAPLNWANILYFGSVFTLIVVGTHWVVFSSWMLQPLQRLIQIARSFGRENVSPQSFPLRIRELHELSQLLVSMIEYSTDLTRRSHELLEQGGRQEIPLRTEADGLGKVFQKLTNTVTALEDLIGEIAKGNLALDIPEHLLKIRLGQAFRVMNTEILNTIVQVRNEVINISRVSARIAAMSQQGSRNATMETQAIERISSSIRQVVENLREVMQNIKLQGDSLDETFTDISDMLVSIEEVNESVEQLSALAEETFRSIGEIYEFMKKIDAHAHSLSEISKTVSTEATDGLQAVDEVIGGIQTIKSTVEEAAAAIQRLGEESERIGEILEVINSVAEQTNLLALNASIIAAQAGEHGRGFAVVAGEIRELAERTRASTKEIGEIIRSLQTEVTHGATAMQHCLDAVRKGVELANHSGTILEKIVESIQGARKMASSLAEATVIQTTNSQQVRDATEQVTQRLGNLYATATKQAQDSTHLGEMANILKDVTHRIDQSAVAQLQETDSIAHAIGSIQELLHRNAKMIHELAESSDDLSVLESNLADNMGHFFITKHQLPPNFDPDCPTIAFIRHGTDLFFNYIYQGVQNALSAEQFQSLLMDSKGDPVGQAVNVSWLLEQPWLKGIVLAPVNEHTGSRLVANVMKRKTSIVVVDFRVKNADVSVVSDNTCGGVYAAELLREKLPGESGVLVFGSRNVYSLVCRMNGFFEKAKSYQWTIMEIFSPTDDVTEAKNSVLEGLKLFPDAQGVFLTNETIALAYLELLREGKFPQQPLYAAGFDITPAIAEAIADEYLLGTIIQDPVQIGNIATRELLMLLRQPRTKKPSTPKEVLVPVRKITKDNLPSEAPLAE
jgi:methyl-accepting chemotaxis protein/ABC-type sugar transport system substrate-binding protein